MLIQNLFVKDIFRSINGVVKAHQLDPSSVWQELDEFVLTKELDRHFRQFLSAYLESIDHRDDPNITARMAVWVSGFFGSGKSHFLKMLYYLLQNLPHTHDGQTKQAVEFFESKVKDAMLFGDVQRAVASKTDVILFNIDSKADPTAGREAILAVFLKVLNEMQGYSGDHPHIAHMERYLDSKGKLGQFRDAYQAITGSEWAAERDVYEFNRDQVVEALRQTLGQSEESVQKWIDNAESNFSLSVENFCKWIKQYLDSKGPDHRLVFLVDEMGQFIGTDGHLMLNLQTITEDLGTACNGRAWIIVTSQEEIDKVIGELRTAAANDFSKIQARFSARLSLSSANVDEVIQSRLLAKRDEVVADLQDLFTAKGDILKHQLTFSQCGMTLKPYKDGEDFVKNYPFAPYQFQLIQRIFESIRRAGATGLHLSRGERSILDAFQSAGKKVAVSEVGALVPLYEFYPCIESFLDTAVKRTIDQAAENTSLDPFDVRLLQVLFLIRYVEEIKGNMDNLVTLCIDQIDADRLALRRRIEESLARLEKETLISRSNDNYFFLTNEERDIGREIKQVDLGSAEEAKLLGELIFDDVLKGQRKHRYSVNKMDFSFARVCDGHPVGGRLEGGLVVSVVSPLADDYELYKDQRCVLESSGEGGQVLIRLRDDANLGRELRAYAKTDKFLKAKSDATLPDQTKRILRDNAEENRVRRDGLKVLLERMLVEAADYFVAGQPLKPTATAPAACLDEALEYLVTNTFSKMGYIKRLNPDPPKEIQAILRSNDIGQQTLALQMDEANPQAIEDLRNYIDLCATASRQVVLYDLIENRYANRPYGWPAPEVGLLLARLIVLGEISLVADSAPIPIEKAYETLTTPAKWRKTTIIKRRTSDPKAIQAARNLGKEVFSEMGPDGEDALCAFLQGKLKAWETALGGYRPLAETGNYPGQDEIADGLSVIRPLLVCDESYKFIERFNERKDDLLALCDDFHDLENFYEHQKPTWERLRKASERFGLNKLELERDGQAAPALARMQEVLAAPSPYGLIKEADGLIAKVEAVNAALVCQRRTDALAKIDGQIAEVSRGLAAMPGDAALKAACLRPLETLRGQVETQESLAHVAEAGQEALASADAALSRIEAAQAAAAAKPATTAAVAPPAAPPVKPRRIVKPADLVASPYLETQGDVDGFLDRLRTELEAAIKEGKRIQIR